jgi:hypothetical protein
MNLGVAASSTCLQIGLVDIPLTQFAVAATFTHPLDLTKVYVIHFSQLELPRAVVLISLAIGECRLCHHYHLVGNQPCFPPCDTRSGKLVGLVYTQASQRVCYGRCRTHLYALARMSLSRDRSRKVCFALLPLHSYLSYSCANHVSLYCTIGQDSKNPTRLILAAAIAGGLGGIAGNPADVLLVRMTSDSLRKPEDRYRYRHAIDGLIRLVREEGVRALARGLGTNTVITVHLIIVTMLMLFS